MTEQPMNTDLLRKVPIFNSLSDKELDRILNAPENVIEEYDIKKIIVKESEIGDCMYVILDGAVEVSIRGEGGFGREITIATLRTGDFFGEQALVALDKTGRRNATVRTLHKTRLFRIDKKYVVLGLGDIEESEDVTIPRMTAKDNEVRQLIEGMRLFKSLKESELECIGTWTEVVTVGPGDFVLKESEKGDCLYVVLDGSVEIFTFDDDGKITILTTHQRGNYFGEQALMPGSTGERSAYARSNGVARLIKIPKAYFRLILNRDSELAESLQKTGEVQKEQLGKLHKT